jgi:hypothetical protein
VWYPIADNYVPAPKDYRAPEGTCTRCGNMYEPPCKTKRGAPLCLAGLYSREPLVFSKDGFCIPRQEQIGCGTSGKALCPKDVVDKLGTIALLNSPANGQSWQIFPTLSERDGCLWSCAPLPHLCF